MKVLLAISGGIDSMYLANRASELFPGASFAVAHCNFHLRGDESDGDERFVREWAGEHGIPCFVKQFDTEGYAASKGVSIEMAARELRYGWFAELCRSEGFDATAVAHNANDNAETLMLNLLRGTGSRGIRGMAASRSEGEGATILRPLLNTTREEIEKWMKTEGHSWREDSTNACSEYKRNRIRNMVFPIFKEINPSFIRTLSADMGRFAQVDDIADDYLSGVRDSVCDPRGIVIDRLLSVKHWQYVLFRLLEPYNLSRETFDKMVGLLDRYRTCPRGTVTVGGKTFESPTHLIEIRGSRISARTRASGQESR